MKEFDVALIVGNCHGRAAVTDVADDRRPSPSVFIWSFQNRPMEIFFAGADATRRKPAINRELQRDSSLP